MPPIKILRRKKMTERALEKIRFFKHICETRGLDWKVVVTEFRRDRRRYTRRYIDMLMIAAYFIVCPEEAFAPFMKNDEQ